MAAAIAKEIALAIAKFFTESLIRRASGAGCVGDILVITPKALALGIAVIHVRRNYSH